MRQVTVNNQNQIQIVGKWKTGELLAIADELRRVALDISVDFAPPETTQQEPHSAAKK